MVTFIIEIFISHWVLKGSVCFLGRSSVNYQVQETRSRLSKTLDQILRDNVATPYFLQFMETRSAEHLVRFWLEAESFRSSSWSRVRAHSLNSVKHSTLAEPTTAPGSPDSPDSLHDPGRASALDEDDSEDPFPSRTSSRPHTPSPQETNHTGALIGHRNSISSEGVARPGTPQLQPTLLSETPTRQSASRTGTPVKGQTTGGMRELSDKLMKSEYLFKLFNVMSIITQSYKKTAALCKSRYAQQKQLRHLI